MFPQPTAQEIETALAAPFPPALVQTRSSRDGKPLDFVNAASVQNRLDDVVGPSNWWDTYRVSERTGAVICELTIRYPWGEEVTKSAVGVPDTTGPIAVKFAGDDAFKRAAVKFGIGRYLYGEGVPSFVAEDFPGLGLFAPSDGVPGNPAYDQTFRNVIKASEDAAKRQGMSFVTNATGPVVDEGGPYEPKDGPEFFGYLKDLDRETGFKLTRWIEQWAKPQGFPWKITEWSPAAVALGFAEVQRKLAELAAQPPKS